MDDTVARLAVKLPSGGGKLLTRSQSSQRDFYSKSDAQPSARSLEKWRC